LPIPTALDVAHRMMPYIEQQMVLGERLHHVIKPLFNLFHQRPGARQYRRHLSENAHRADADITVFEAALACIKPLLDGDESLRRHA
ncbi:MAG: tRNA-dihydrouridine synthase, partial [Natronospirillum sp.]